MPIAGNRRISNRYSNPGFDTKDPSLVLYLPLYYPDSETTGSTIISKDIYRRSCTVTGATWGSKGRIFDGTDDQIACGNSSALNFTTGDFTLEGWIYVDDYDNVVYIFSRGGVDLTGYQFIIESNGQLKLYTSQAAADQATYTGTGAITATTWYHIAAVRRQTSALDIGSGATNLNDFTEAGLTMIDLANPVESDGIITSIELWANTNIAGMRVGSFYLSSGTTYVCRASVAIGDVTSGSKQTFPVSLQARAGDFIGLYWDSGRLETSPSGGTSVAIKTGEYIDANDSASYTINANWRIAAYGIGAAVTLYINGAEPSQTFGVHIDPKTSTDIAYLGARKDLAAQFFDGKIGEFRVYSRALTPPEIQRNYLVTKWRYQ